MEIYRVRGCRTYVAPLDGDNQEEGGPDCELPIPYDIARRRRYWSGIMGKEAVTYARVGGTCVSTINAKTREMSLSVCFHPVRLRTSPTARRMLRMRSVMISSSICLSVATLGAACEVRARESKA